MCIFDNTRCNRVFYCNVIVDLPSIIFWMHGYLRNIHLNCWLNIFIFNSEVFFKQPYLNTVSSETVNTVRCCSHVSLDTIDKLPQTNLDFDKTVQLTSFGES